MSQMDPMKERPTGALISTVTKLINLVLLLLVAIVAITVAFYSYDKPLFTINWIEGSSDVSSESAVGTTDSKEQSEKASFFTEIHNPLEELKEQTDLNSEYIKYGYQLISETYKYIGPENGDAKMVYTGNNLACKNCHLDAGQKKFSAPYVGVFGRFPQYRGRENTIGTLQDRVNGCMERSMNGKKLPVDGKEMTAIMAYMKWVSDKVPTGEKIEGSGFVKVEIPNRKVDLAHGEEVYKMKCASCHGVDGQGIKMPSGLGYTYPPLWGNDSYNHGAGMNRVLTAAQFIKGNMPFGATSENPMVTDEEAYDVAGFIDSHQRPKKKNTEKDYPKLERKPVSAPYGPYADEFSQEQHQFGPFQEIMAYYEKEYNLKKTK